MVSFSADARIAELEMRAILFLLVAFAHADGHFDVTERAFIRDTIDTLVDTRARESFGADPAAWSDAVTRWRAHFYHATASIEHEIRTSFTESVAEGESAGQFVAARLKLRCFELLQRLGPDNRAALLRMADDLIRADGHVHPLEQRFREDLLSLFTAEDAAHIDPSSPGSRRGAALILDEPRPRPLAHADHPFFHASEHAYAREPAAFAHQAAADMTLIQKVEERLWEQRSRGQGRLAAAPSFAAFSGHDPFLDGHVYVVPPRARREYEILVLGDLHGCYSCLKAALMQGDFFARVEAYRKDPDRAPYPMLIFLGDYIDRGHHSYDGVLRSVLRVFLAAPEHVFVLRGNHEHYMDHGGRIESPVRPSEAIHSIEGIAPRALLDAHMRLFEMLPCTLVFDRTIFVHAGIPREDTAAQKLTSLAGLNDPEVRQQMLWSDPSDADHVPIEMQRQNTRFPFGRAQFSAFMRKIGCGAMIRGHERVVEGVRVVYKDPEATLVSLFSAGGAYNDDLPPHSNYREVTPMALSIRHRDGVSRVTPFPIEYARYRDPAVNRFAAARGPQSGR
jgi:Calcineurin-like phosphoesterase